MELREKLKILDLSLKEEKVLMSLLHGLRTPLRISKQTRVTRPSVYAILKKLKKRGIATTTIVRGKHFWTLSRNEDIDACLYEAKKTLLSISEGTEEVKGMSDSTIIVHRGTEAIQRVLIPIAKQHKDERLYSLSGNGPQPGWETHMGQEKINEFNRSMQKNGILTETVLTENWFEDHVRTLGLEKGTLWAKGFLNRAFAAFEVDPSYMMHAGQIFIFKNSLYLMAMNEGLVIEIRNSELQKMIKQMFTFIEDHASRINVIERLEKIIQRVEQKKLEQA